MKTSDAFIVLLTAGAAIAMAQTASAQTYVTANPVAIIRNGANANTDQLEPAPGGTTVSVKYDGASNTRKYYGKVILTGNPNTNGPVYVKYDAQVNSPQSQRILLWTLNQDYPSFQTNITWNTAQANDTNSFNSLLTDPTNTFTAISYGTFVSPNGGGAGVVHQLNGGPWAHMIRSGNTIYFAMTSTENIGNNGTRFVQDSVQLGFEEITSGAPPYMGPITNELAANGQLTAIQGFNSTATNHFTVSDAETAVASLTITNVTSSEANLPSANVFVTGTDTNRSVYVSAPPTATPGTYTVTLSLVDGDGNRATRSFAVVIQQFNLPPIIIAAGETNSIAPTNTLLNTPINIPFAVSDAETTNNSTLTVSASVASYSTNVLLSAVVNGSGPNTNLSVTVTPQTGVDGVGVVRISVSDTNGNTNTIGFSVMVRPNADVIFIDHFDYQANNSKLTDDAPGFWTRRNATPQAVFLRTATSVIDNISKVAWLRPNSGAESLAAPLAGGVYDPTNRAVLYTKFTATFAELTAGNLITNLNGDNPFFRMSEAPTATTDFVSLVALNEQSASDFTFWHANGVAEGPFATWASDFAKPTGVSTLTKTIVTRYDVSTAKSTLWLDATSESDPNITGTDAQDLTPVGYVGLWQNRGNGDIYIDDMTVTLKIKPLVTAAAPASGSNVDIYFNAGAADTIGDFLVERASTVDGAYSNVTATVTSLGGGNFRATVAAPGTQGYYKVKRVPFTF